jgi:hypothetical protein
MIDWRRVLTNLLWIAGAATMLAVLSSLDWQASLRRDGQRLVSKRLLRSVVFISGIALVCLGAGLGVLQPWERVLWLLLAVGSASWAGWIWLSQRKERQQ